MTWATSVPILVFLGLSVLDLGPIYATDRRHTSDRRQTKALLNAPAYQGQGITIAMDQGVRLPVFPPFPSGVTRVICAREQSNEGPPPKKCDVGIMPPVQFSVKGTLWLPELRFFSAK